MRSHRRGSIADRPYLEPGHGSVHAESPPLEVGEVLASADTSAFGREPGECTLGRWEKLSWHSGEPLRDDIGVDESGVDQRRDEVLILLAECAELSDAQVLLSALQAQFVPVDEVGADISYGGQKAEAGGATGRVLGHHVDLVEEGVHRSDER